MSSQFASPVALNFFGYCIVDNNKHATADNVTASFNYRGYEVAFSTFNPTGAKIIVLRNKVLIDEFHTVEASLAAIDELLNWRGNNTVQTRERRGWQRH